LFTPVCPHSLSFRPLIFPDSANIKIKVSLTCFSLSLSPLANEMSRCSTDSAQVPSGSRSSAWLTCDGRNRTELFPNDYVCVTHPFLREDCNLLSSLGCQVKISEWPVPVLCKNDETSDWFHSVTEILHWNERKQQKPTL
jgi:NAD+ kinase